MESTVDACKVVEACLTCTDLRFDNLLLSISQDNPTSCQLWLQFSEQHAWMTKHSESLRWTPFKPVKPKESLLLGFDERRLPDAWSWAGAVLSNPGLSLQWQTHAAGLMLMLILLSADTADDPVPEIQFFWSFFSSSAGARDDLPSLAGF